MNKKKKTLIKKKNKCGFLLFFDFVLFSFFSSIQKENELLPITYNSDSEWHCTTEPLKWFSKKVFSEPMKKLQTLSMANQRRICASLYLGVCAAALGRSGVLLTLGQYVPLSLACHGRDYMLQTAGSTALAILIQSLIKISCKSHRQTVSWPVIGTINPPTERVAEGCPEEGMKGDLWWANDGSGGSTVSVSPSFKMFTSTFTGLSVDPLCCFRWSALHYVLTIHTSSV